MTMSTKDKHGQTVGAWVRGVDYSEATWKRGASLTINGYEYAQGAPIVEMDIWDRAPVALAPRGFCDPWWALADGRWYVVSWARANSNGWYGSPVAYEMTEQVHDAHDRLRAMPSANDSREAVGGGWGTTVHGCESVRRATTPEALFR